MAVRYGPITSKPTVFPGSVPLSGLQWSIGLAGPAICDGAQMTLAHIPSGVLGDDWPVEVSSNGVFNSFGPGMAGQRLVVEIVEDALFEAVRDHK